MRSETSVVVLTPVKNEAWILNRFLSVTSRIANLIIVADQGSADASVAICRRFPNVVVIKNVAEVYDEASRQLLLIDEARRRVPGRKVLLALDADEIMAADAFGSPDWEAMLNSDPGTVLCFEKPDLYPDPLSCVRYKTPWPLGYIDDGATHRPKRIHSLRIPIPSSGQCRDVNGVKILHYACTRPRGQRAKIRLYSVLENLHGTQPLYRRLRAYPHREEYFDRAILEQSLPEWTVGWEKEGIDMHSVADAEFHWQDIEVLRAFNKHGVRRFWLDDIWEFDWEACRLKALVDGCKDVPKKRIGRPHWCGLVTRRLKVAISRLDKMRASIGMLPPGRLQQ